MTFEYKDGTPIEVGDIVEWTSSGPGESHKRRGQVLALVGINIPIRSMIPKLIGTSVVMGEIRNLASGVQEYSKVSRVLVAVWNGPTKKPHLMSPIPGSLRKAKKQVWGI